MSGTVELHVSDWQADLIESPARYRTAAVGRRGGKNEAANTDQIEYARRPHESPWGTDEDAYCWWIGPTYDQSKKWGFDKALEKIPRAVIEGEPKRTEPYQIDLKNGATIEYRTYDKPESLQGAGVDHLVIDEAAYMPRSLWDNDLEPMLMDTLGQAIFISKPIGRGWFFEMHEKGNSEDYPDHDSFHATSAENPFLAENPEDKRGSVPERTYRQEYLAEFVDESGGVFSELDGRLFTADYGYSQSAGVAYDGEPPYAHGWDLARHEDWTVGIVLDTHGDVVHFDRMRGLSWPQIQTRIESAYSDYEGTVAVDATRDNKLVSDLESTGMPVLPVKFSPQQKTELIENLVATIESDELTAPAIPQLEHELQIFEYDVTPSGNTRYHAPDGMKDDSVDSMALANHARTNHPSAKNTDYFRVDLSS